LCKVKRERLQYGQSTIGGDAVRICVQDNEEEVGGRRPSMGAAEQDAMSFRFGGEVELTAPVNEQRSALFLRFIGALIRDIYHGLNRLDLPSRVRTVTRTF
jgi:hypothetical protein